MFTRIGLFINTSIAMLAVLSISMRVLGIDQMLAAEGIGMNLTGLLFMAAIIVFAGSFISLAMSKFMAKRSMGFRLIEQPSNSNERWLMETISRQAALAGIGMPEVGINDRPSVENAKLKYLMSELVNEQKSPG